MTTTTKEYIYNSAADFLGPDRSVENELQIRKDIRKSAEEKIAELRQRRASAIEMFQVVLAKEAWEGIANWARRIDGIDTDIRYQKWLFEGNSKRYIELLDRKDKLKEMLAKELA